MSKAWSSRRGVIGGVEVMIATLLLLLLAPWSAGSIVRPDSATITAPYRGTSATQQSTVSIFGCASAKFTGPKWVPTAGKVLASVVGSARTCTSQAKFGGGLGAALGTSTITLPFNVLTNGSHSIAWRWTVRLASASSYSQGTCPVKKLNASPPLNHGSASYCHTLSELDFVLRTMVVDLNHGGWSGTNLSSLQVQNQSFWGNYSECYNYGHPICVNFTNAGVWGGASLLNGAESGPWTWNGVDSVTLWTNATSMAKADRFALVVSVWVLGTANANAVNLKAPWVGSAYASINIATLGDQLKLDSITIR